MKKIFLLSLLALLVPLGGGCGSAGAGNSLLPKTSSVAMKGYELYSWKIGEEWHFFLTEGTNRIKTYFEITTSPDAVTGADKILEKIGALGRGEQIF